MRQYINKKKNQFQDIFKFDNLTLNMQIYKNKNFIT